MENITLEERLREYAEKNREQYEALLNTWLHNKARCAILLDSVSDNYVYYSTHSAEHSDMVLRNIERLLDNHRIRLLSATDIWLLLHSAYMHDLGMVIPYKEYTEVWEEPDFQEYLKKSQHATNPDLCEASMFLDKISKDSAEDGKQPGNWPLRVRRASVIVISEYFRRRHAERIKPYVEKPYENGRLSFDNVNNRRIVNLIQRVSCLHTADSDELMKLEQETVGFGRDLAHPRFVAELLRLGDALDLDAGRFSPDFEFLHGKRPEYSQEHADLHNAVTDFLIKPEKVIYRANYQSRNAYLLAQTLTGYLTEEFRFCALNWPKIVPANFPGPVPQFQFSMREDLRIKDRPDYLGLAGLRFTLSEKKAFQLLEGSNIYKDDMVFIRELLQNALDASKIQLWRDIRNRFESRRGIPPDVRDENLQPYHIPRELFENYPIDIRIRKVPEEELREEEPDKEGDSGGKARNPVIEIAFEDRGTGFTVESVKRMCEVTESYSYPDCEKELADMPKWLQPTGGFGIGLQSAFLATEEIRVDTQSDDGAHLSMIIESPTKRGGAVIVEMLDEPRKGGRGSTLTLRFEKEPEEIYDAATLETRFVSYDETLYEKVEEFFSVKFRNSMFPVTAHWGEKTCAPEGIDFHSMFPRVKEWDDYCYYLSDDGTWIEIWDKEKASLAHWELTHQRFDSMRHTAFFKGMRLDADIEPKECLHFYADYWIDAYGLSADKNLELSRETLTEKGEEAFQEAVKRTGEAYMDILADKIQSELESGSQNPGLLIRKSSKNPALIDNAEGCFRFDFWMSADSEVRKKLSEQHADWFRDSNITAKRLVAESGQYSVQKMKPEELIAQYASLPCAVVASEKVTQDDCNLIFQSVRQMPKPYKDCNQIICTVFRLSKSNNNSYYNIATLSELLENVHAICLWKISDPFFGRHVKFVAIKFYDSSSDTLCTNLSAKNAILSSWEINYYSHIPAIRIYLPALSGYELLRLNKKQHIRGEILPVDCGFSFPDKYVIISPITYNDRDALRETPTSEEFALYLEATEPFQKLVAYVAERAETHLPEERKKDEIKKKYLELAEDIWTAYHEDDTETPSESAEASGMPSADVSEPETPVSADVKEETKHE